ncbi:MAG: triose-phosphate isomerase [Proteobacteria bacterium]|nr:triose-phosphate isomerase [Pseudomonadota bacterium]
MQKSSLIIGNWKMQMTFSACASFFTEFCQEISKNYNDNSEILICPSFIHIYYALECLRKYKLEHKIFVGAQDCFYYSFGTFTGQVSPSSLSEMGCKYVIIGHAECRALYKDDGFINQRIVSALNSDLLPILCIGELDKEKQYKTLKEQLHYHKEFIVKSKKIIIAYEPIWAIGGDALPDETHIRKAADIITETLPDAKVVYGGSVNELNAKSILNIENISGLLVGSASLSAKGFLKICRA